MKKMQDAWPFCFLNKKSASLDLIRDLGAYSKESIITYPLQENVYDSNQVPHIYQEKNS